MPRKPRIDAPGLLYHVIARGIERREIFSNDKDSKFFIDELGELLIDTRTQIYAFALIPNHFHLLLRRIDTPIPTLMRRLLTKYAIYYNKRNKRSGHLFQNRYKAIICQEEPYLLELIRYIHLNPYRAGMVKNLKELKSYPFSGHGYLVGDQRGDWYDKENVLIHFGKTKEKAKNAYLKFISDGLSRDKRADLVGGGLKRSLGFPKHYPKTNIAFDDRVLGEGSFVENLLALQKDDLPSTKNDELQKLFNIATKRFEVTKAEILGRAKLQRIVQARVFMIVQMIAELGYSASEAARELSLSKSRVSKMLEKRKCTK